MRATWFGLKRIGRWQLSERDLRLGMGVQAALVLYLVWRIYKDCQP